MAGAAAVATHYIKPFTGSSTKLNFDLKAAVSNSTTERRSMLRSMSSVLIATDFEIKNKVNER